MEDTDIMANRLKIAAFAVAISVLYSSPAPAKPGGGVPDFCTGQAMAQCEDSYGTENYSQCANAAYLSCVQDNPDLYPGGGEAHGFGPDFWEYLHFCYGRITC